MDIEVPRIAPNRVPSMEPMSIRDLGNIDCSSYELKSKLLKGGYIGVYYRAY